jgi:hypothetical protein
MKSRALCYVGTCPVNAPRAERWGLMSSYSTNQKVVNYGWPLLLLDTGFRIYRVVVLRSIVWSKRSSVVFLSMKGESLRPIVTPMPVMDVLIVELQVYTTTP